MSLPKEIGDREYQKFFEDDRGNVGVRTGVEPLDGPSLDAFGRQRTTAPATIFDNKQIVSNQPLFWDDSEVSGSGTTSTYSKAKASTTLAVSANTAGRRVRRTFQRFNYQPGKSQEILMTTQLTSDETLQGISACVGYFDDEDGVFFAAEDGVIYAVVRSSVSGVTTDTAIAQADWNVDKFDGNGPSGITLDPTSTNILVFDMEWLGVGRVRFGFNVNGVTYYVHEQNHSNVIPTVYMSKANLPLSYDLQNDGTGAAASLQHICTTVISEGGQQQIGTVRAVSNGTTQITATTAGTLYALKGIRLKSTDLTTTILMEKVSIIITSSGAFEWLLLWNPTVAGTFTYSDLNDSSVQHATGTSSNTVTGGYQIDHGYGASAGTGGSAAGTAGGDLKNALHLGAAIDGTRDTIVLAVRATTNSETFLGGLVFRELA
jgi:hypothetical protein